MIGILAGSGIDSMITGSELFVETQYGNVVCYESQIADKPVIILPRHGLSHSVLPHLINYKSNITALTELDVTCVLSLCAVGSLSIDYSPETLVLLTDFINAAGGRIDSFYSAPDSEVVHTDFSEPYCLRQNNLITKAAEQSGIELVTPGVYVGVTGPRYETPAEVRAYRNWGGDVVGMTGVTECALAKEAGLCYSSVAMVTNYGTGLAQSVLDHAEVELAAKSVLARITLLLDAVVPMLTDTPDCSCRRAK